MLRKLIKFLVKTILILAAIALLIVAVTAIIDHIASDLHGELKLEESPDGNESYLMYRGNRYYSASELLDLTSLETDVQIGWQYGFPFPNFYFYTDGTETPLYIYSVNSGMPRGIFVRSDCDFKKQTYIVEGTDIEIVFDQVFTKTRNDTVFHNKHSDVHILLSLKDEPRLEISLYLNQAEDGTWFFVKNGECYVANEEFVSVLKKNDIID